MSIFFGTYIKHLITGWQKHLHDCRLIQNQERTTPTDPPGNSDEVPALSPCWDPSPHQGAGFVLAHLEARFWPSLRLQIDSLSKKKESCKEEAMIYATNLELQKSFINDA